jgi:hypothetical protein
MQEGKWLRVSLSEPGIGPVMRAGGRAGRP